LWRPRWCSKAGRTEAGCSPVGRLYPLKNDSGEHNLLTNCIPFLCRPRWCSKAGRTEAGWSPVGRLYPLKTDTWEHNLLTHCILSCEGPDGAQKAGRTEAGWSPVGRLYPLKTDTWVNTIYWQILHPFCVGPDGAQKQAERRPDDLLWGGCILLKLTLERTQFIDKLYPFLCRPRWCSKAGRTEVGWSPVEAIRPVGPSSGCPASCWRPRWRRTTVQIVQVVNFVWNSVVHKVTNEVLISVS
jgi:hypothetical protein